MKTDTHKSYKERMLRVLPYIQKHLDEKVSLEDLARVACFSPFHFHRIFKGMMGESLKEHIRRLRLERAGIQLRKSSSSITQIAFQAGYGALESFIRAFKEMFGLAPSEYRNHYQSLGQDPVLSGMHYFPGEDNLKLKTIRPGGKTMDVRIETFGPVKVAFMRHTGSYQTCGQTWGKFAQWAASRGLFGKGKPIIGASYDDPEVTPPERCRYDCCIQVDDDFMAEGEIGIQTIGGEEYAVYTHKGPYGKVAESFQKLIGEWLPRSGRDAKMEACLEIYRDEDCSKVPEEELTTDIMVPLHPEK